MPTQARIIDVADAVVDYLVASNPPSGGTKAVRRYITPMDAEKEVGRWAYVFPSKRRFGQGRTRGRRAHVFEVSVVVAERIPADCRSESAREAWADSMVLWVEDNVFLPLTNEQTLDLIPGSAVYPVDVGGGIVDVLNNDAWSQYKLFWSQVDLGFWEG